MEKVNSHNQLVVIVENNKSLAQLHLIGH